MPHRVRLRGDSAALYLDDRIELILGFGDFERLQDMHPGSVAREVVLERSVIDADRSAAWEHANSCDRGLAPPGTSDDVLLFWHRNIVPRQMLIARGFWAECGWSAPRYTFSFVNNLRPSRFRGSIPRTAISMSRSGLVSLIL